MMMAQLYTLEESGKNMDAIQIMLRDFINYLVSKNPNNVDELDEDFVVVFHPETLRKVANSSIVMSYHIARMRTGEAAHYPGLDIVQTQLKVMNFDIASSTSVAENEMVVINRGLMELFERMANNIIHEANRNVEHERMRGTSPDRIIIDDINRSVRPLLIGRYMGDDIDGDKNANGRISSVYSKPDRGLRARCRDMLGQRGKRKLRGVHKKDSEDGA